MPPMVEEADEGRLEVAALADGRLQLARRAREEQLPVGEHEHAVGVALGLTPVVRQMLLGDLPRSLLWGQHGYDRGRALEDAWRANTGGTTATRMADLADGEKAGLRPSLSLSPMVIEWGKFLLISNLDVEGLGGGIQFFPKFRQARDEFELGTAVRMNATFPFFSPPVDLPTDPPRRVVDAGYFDNYGVSLAAAFLFSKKNMDWFRDNVSKIVLIQIRDGQSDDERVLK